MKCGGRTSMHKKKQNVKRCGYKGGLFKLQRGSDLVQPLNHLTILITLNWNELFNKLFFAFTFLSVGQIILNTFF